MGQALSAPRDWNGGANQPQGRCTFWETRKARCIPLPRPAPDGVLWVAAPFRSDPGGMKVEASGEPEEGEKTAMEWGVGISWTRGYIHFLCADGISKCHFSGPP